MSPLAPFADGVNQDQTAPFADTNLRPYSAFNLSQTTNFKLFQTESVYRQQI